MKYILLIIVAGLSLFFISCSEKVIPPELIYEDSTYPEKFEPINMTGIIEEKVVGEGTQREWSYFVFKVPDNEYLINSYHWKDNIRPNINTGLDISKASELDGKEAIVEAIVQKNIDSLILLENHVLIKRIYIAQ